MSAGLLALIENPDELERLRRDPALVKSAVEETLRWASPVAHFARTATVDTELHGQKIRKGDVVALIYASANRDEDVFEDPFRFRIDRSPNPHLAASHRRGFHQLARVQKSGSGFGGVHRPNVPERGGVH